MTALRRLLAALAVALLAGPAAAQYTWTATAGGAWTTGGNWSGGAAPNAAGATATFTSTAAAQTITAAGGTLGAVTFDHTAAASSFGYTFSSGSTLTLDAGGGGNPAVFTVLGGANAAGTHTFNNALTFAAGTPWSVVNNGSPSPAVTSLSFAGTLTGAATPVTVSGTGNTSISGALDSGFTTITKSGSGTLTLASASNLYSGDLTISGGTVVTTKGAQALGAATAGIVFNGGNLSVTGTGSAVTHAVTLQAHATIDTALGATLDTGGGNYTLGTYTLTKTGAGTLTVGGTGSAGAGGGVAVTGGTLRLNSAAAVAGSIWLGDTTGSAATYLTVAAAGTVAAPVTVRAGSSGAKAITFIAAGTLSQVTADAPTSINFNWSQATVAALALNAAVTVSTVTAGQGYVGTLTGTGSLSKTGQGEMLFNMSSPGYSGAVTVYEGTKFRVSADAALGTGTVTFSAINNINFSSSGATNVTLNNPIVFATGNRDVDLTAVGNIFTLAGPVSGTQAITFGVNSGGPLVALTGSGAGYSGNMTVKSYPLHLTPAALAFTGNLDLGGSTTGADPVLLTSGTFARTLGTAAGQVQLTSSAGNGTGFAARGGPLAVSLSGGAALTWGPAASSPTPACCGSARPTPTMW